MEYRVESHGSKILDVKRERLEEVLRGAMPFVERFSLVAELPVPLKAEVLRNLKPGKEIVRLSSGRKHVDLLRDVEGEPGDIGVSCEPRGDKVPVETLNIEFRDIDDELTDRGLVWVHPSNPAFMTLVIESKALETPGKAMEIITAAEEAVKTKVLAHFQKKRKKS